MVAMSLVFLLFEVGWLVFRPAAISDRPSPTAAQRTQAGLRTLPPALPSGEERRRSPAAGLVGGIGVSNTMKSICYRISRRRVMDEWADNRPMDSDIGAAETRRTLPFFACPACLSTLGVELAGLCGFLTQADRSQTSSGHRSSTPELAISGMSRIWSRTSGSMRSSRRTGRWTVRSVLPVFSAACFENEKLSLSFSLPPLSGCRVCHGLPMGHPTHRLPRWS